MQQMVNLSACVLVQGNVDPGLGQLYVVAGGAYAHEEDGPRPRRHEHPSRRPHGIQQSICLRLLLHYLLELEDLDGSLDTGGSRELVVRLGIGRREVLRWS